VAQRRAEDAAQAATNGEVLIPRRIKPQTARRIFFEHASARQLGPNRVQSFDSWRRQIQARRCGRRSVEDRMRRFAQAALLACCCALAGAAFAFDNGQYEHVPPDIRAWFKSVIAPNGVPCCDISDGHRTEYDVRGGAYWVPIEGKWVQVPAHAIIRDRGNPVGEAVVWYVHHRGSIVISCFVPADAV
jgi:hypothetical protein